jgi:Rieske Fe-S protein
VLTNGSHPSSDAFPLRAADEQRLDRRRFLTVAGCAALLVAGGEWLAQRGEHAGAAPARAAIYPGAIGVGESRAAPMAGGGEALVVRLSADEVVAFDRRCPHLGCPVVWSAAAARFECPCHRAAFDARTGAVLFGPPRRGLTAAIVRAA